MKGIKILTRLLGEVVQTRNEAILHAVQLDERVRELESQLENKGHEIAAWHGRIEMERADYPLAILSDFTRVPWSWCGVSRVGEVARCVTGAGEARVTLRCDEGGWHATWAHFPATRSLSVAPHQGSVFARGKGETVGGAVLDMLLSIGSYKAYAEEEGEETSPPATHVTSDGEVSHVG